MCIFAEGTDIPIVAVCRILFAFSCFSGIARFAYMEGVASLSVALCGFPMANDAGNSILLFVQRKKRENWKGLFLCFLSFPHMDSVHSRVLL